MICNHLPDLLGIECIPLDETGAIAMVASPFHFIDGTPFPIFARAEGATTRFFDDGRLFLHFRGRGLSLATRQQARFIVTAADRHDVTYGPDWVLEVSAFKQDAPAAFGRYLATLHDVAAWEREQEGAVEDGDLLVEEAILAFRAANPAADIQREPMFRGVSGKSRRLSLSVDGTGVAVTSTHHAAVNAALHAMVDIRQCAENQGRSFMFLMADAMNPTKAKQDALVLQAAAPVQLLSNLQRQALSSAVLQ